MGMADSKDLFSSSRYRWREILSNWEFFLFGFTLPLSISLNHVSIFLITARWLFLAYKFKDFSFKWIKSYVVLMPLYFFIIAASILYSTNYLKGLFEIEKLIYFIIIPLSFSIIQRKDVTDVFRKLATGFVVGNLVLGLQFLIRYSLYDWQDTVVDDVIQNISPLHPTYLSLFFSIGIIFMGGIIFEKGILRYLAILFIMYFSMCIILAASKLGVLFLFVSLLYIAYLIIKRSSRLIGIGFILVSIISLAIVAFQSEVLVERFLRVMSLEFNRDPVAGFNTFSGRLFFWDCALKIYKDHPILGVGVGDTQHELDLCYLANEETVDDDFLRTYNAHNQFLQTLLDSGLAGFLALLFLVFSLIRQSVKSREIIPFLITLLIILFFLLESVLARDKGIVFFSSFVCMVYYWLQNNKGETN